MKKVEQITKQGKITLDFDESYRSTVDLKAFLSKYVTIKNNKNPFEVEYNGRQFFFCIKSITYLGHPHPVFKKRIQIPAKWKRALQKKNTLLAGFYKYKDNNLVVFFDPATYRSNRLNNSSAHVYTIDLLKGIEYGVFSKTDRRGNKITVVHEDSLHAYLNILTKGTEPDLPPELALLEGFARSLKKTWKGRQCYQEMMGDKYRNANQSEWPGFYLEYKFELLNKGKPASKKVCIFVSNKKKNDLDFDLNFHNEFLGDLKMHTDTVREIIGNDLRSVEQAVKKHSKLWYVAFSHHTNKDKDRKYEVTRYWNGKLGKKNLLSYGGRMKHSVTLIEMVVLEIHRGNWKHLKAFAQGKNPGGYTRNLKISIPVSGKNIDNFLIHRTVL